MTKLFYMYSTLLGFISFSHLILMSNFTVTGNDNEKMASYF